MRRETAELKLLADYTLMGFSELMELDCYTYRLLLKDAFIYAMSKTKEGQEYLETAWILEQTKPDRRHLRQKFKMEGGE